VSLTTDGSILRFVLTERAQGLAHHGGQISFPGGVVEPEDEGPLGAALRECEEEMGWRREALETLGALDETFTSAGFAITPFVVRVLPGTATAWNPEEITRVLRPPVSAFLAEGALRYEDRTYEGRVLAVPFFTCGEDVVWGATARIIVSFLERYRVALTG